jgi:hypothetical protein
VIAGRAAGVALCLALAVAGCARSPTPPSTPNTSAATSAGLNGLSAMDAVGKVHSAGLPTPNAHDVTSDKCAKLHCVGAVDSDTVSILKFDHTGAAQQYAGSISNSYQLEDLVVVFAPTLTDSEKLAYERALEHAIA